MEDQHCGLLLTQSAAGACDQEESVENLGKLPLFVQSVKMQSWLIYGILLVTEWCLTLDTAVDGIYFALFSMGAHLTGLTPGVILLSKHI